MKLTLHAKANALSSTIRFSIRYVVLTLLSLIGVGIIIRRIVTLWPTLVSGYQPSVITSRSNSPFGQSDSIFEQYPLITLIHILPALLFIGLGPLQFSRRIRRRHLTWHRWSGRIFLLASSIIGITALWLSVAVPPLADLIRQPPPHYSPCFFWWRSTRHFAIFGSATLPCIGSG